VLNIWALHIWCCMHMAKTRKKKQNVMCCLDEVTTPFQQGARRSSPNFARFEIRPSKPTQSFVRIQAHETTRRRLRASTVWGGDRRTAGDETKRVRSGLRREKVLDVCLLAAASRARCGGQQNYEERRRFYISFLKKCSKE
jgi:hypothetical protein